MKFWCKLNLRNHWTCINENLGLICLLKNIKIFKISLFSNMAAKTDKSAANRTLFGTNCIWETTGYISINFLNYSTYFEILKFPSLWNTLSISSTLWYHMQWMISIQKMVCCLMAAKNLKLSYSGYCEIYSYLSNRIKPVFCLLTV